VSPDFQISLPNWSRARILKESCASWNLRHPEDEHADPEESEWPLLFNVIHSFLRHQQTHYEEALAAGAGRDELRERISRAAAKAYTWLRIEHDPRTNDDKEPELERKDYRPFNSFSRQLSDLISERSRLTVAIKDARRKRAEGWREHVVEMEERLAEVNARVEKLNRLFKPSERIEGGVLVNSIFSFHSVMGYDFAGRGELPESYTKTIGITCPQCGRAVLRTKCAIDHGAGKRQVAFSCFCLSLSVESPYASGVGLMRWAEMIGGRDQSTDIVIYDQDGGLLYGGKLLEDIAAGRKDGSKVKEFRGVVWDAFHALLTVKFRDHPLVEALDDEVAPELLERISNELVLTADDIELVLDVQARVATGSE
jgi:hypothetical protein